MSRSRHIAIATLSAAATLVLGLTPAYGQEDPQDQVLVPRTPGPLDDPEHAGSLLEPPSGDVLLGGGLTEIDKAMLIRRSLSEGALNRALLQAIAFDNATTVAEVIRRGADPNAVFDLDTRVTALHAAASGNRLAVIPVLLAAGADPNATANGEAFFTPDLIARHQLVATDDGWTPEDVARGNLQMWRAWRVRGHAVLDGEDLDQLIRRADLIVDGLAAATQTE